MHPCKDPQDTSINYSILIDFQPFNGGSASRCETIEARSIRRPFEMFCPDLGTRIEQLNNRACLRVRSGGCTRLAQITIPAGQTEVIKRIIPIWVNMIHLHGLPGNTL